MNIYIRQQSGKKWTTWAAAGGLLIALAVTLSVSSQTVPIKMPLAAPTILRPVEGDLIASGKGMIVGGVTKNNTQVEVFFDGKSVGYAEVAEHPSGTASFAAHINQEEMTEGAHSVKARAMEQNGALSVFSGEIYFIVAYPYPAPVLKQPVVNSATVFTRPWIIGVARSGDEVEIMLDGKVVGRVVVADHPSGTGSFQWRPQDDLAGGWHSVRARSIGRKESEWSKAYVFAIQLPGTLVGTTAPGIASQYAEQPEQEAPAPTILEPVAQAVVAPGEWKIAGVVHNGYRVQIFQDDTLLGEIHPAPDPSGVAHFIFQPPRVLPYGESSIRTRAVTRDGSYSAFSEEVPILIKPDIKQLTVISSAGASLWPPVQTARIGSGIKVVKESAARQENDTTEPDLQSKVFVNDGTIEEDERIVTIVSDEENPEMRIPTSTLPQREPILEENIMPQKTGTTPEIEGPVFDPITALEEIEALLGSTSATDTPSSSMPAVTESSSNRSDSEVTTSLLNSSVFVQNDSGKVESFDSGVAAAAKTSSRPYRPEALVLIAAGVIILIGIVVTVIRDRMQLRAQSVDFSNAKEALTINLDHPQAGYPAGVGIPPPPPPPSSV